MNHTPEQLREMTEAVQAQTRQQIDTMRSMCAGDGDVVDTLATYAGSVFDACEALEAAIGPNHDSVSGKCNAARLLALAVRARAALLDGADADAVTRRIQQELNEWQ